jgi:amino acid adenylation domain-containing protein
MLRLNEEVTTQINSYAQKHRITVNTLMQGVWSYLLHSYTGSENVVYGVIVSGRPDDLAGVEKRVGMYINTLPLHSTLNSEKQSERGIAEWLQELQSDQVSSRHYQYTPLQEIQKFTKVIGDLFDSLLVFENYPVSEIVKAKQWSLKVENMQMKEQTNYPLTIAIGSSDKINMNFSFNAAVLKKEYAEEIRDHFENVLMQIVSKDDIRPDEIKLLTNNEEEKILKEFNNTFTDYPDYKNIIELFDEKVSDSPDSIAVMFEEKQLTYKELDERSNQLAHFLISSGIKTETLVPLILERSLEMILAIFGIIKAGGAYVPIDPEYPEERIKFMLEDTGAKILLSSSKSKKNIPVIAGLSVLSIDELQSEISKHSTQKVKENIEPTQLAYVIYTSGSTGKPKGVMIEHKGVLNLSQSQKDLLRLKPEMKTLQFASIGFDASCYEIFNTILSGGCLVLCNKEDLSTSESFEKLINNYKVDLAVLPATFQNIIKESTGTISTIVSAGEVLNEETGKYFQSKGIRLINAYGPTETTVCASLSDDPIKENNLITIGRPNPNQQIYLIDNSNNLCPVGVAGEICVAGIQIARGYLNQPELTLEKFIPNPFVDKSNSTLYKTGDLGKWLPDGNIEYLGRLDDQVKIRGYRIELGEIESVINQSELVEQAVVIAKNDKDKNKRLVAFIIPKVNFNKEELMNYLRVRLPEYMVPALWKEMESFPVTKSGKIDRNSLPELDAENLIRNEYVEARNDTERKISDIWKELLQIERVGVYDNFFELGGHSLLAMRVITAIQKEFEIELAVKDLFNFTNISDLSKYLDIQNNVFIEEKDSTEYEQFTL